MGPRGVFGDCAERSPLCLLRLFRAYATPACHCVYYFVSPNERSVGMQLGRKPARALDKTYKQRSLWCRQTVGRFG